MEFNDVVKERISIRKYSNRAVSWQDIVSILDSARLAPVAGNIFTVRLIVVDSKEKKKKLAEAAGQGFLADAHYILIICSDTKQIERSYGERGLIYSRQQAGAIIENMLLKITDLGLASCWIGAFNDDVVKTILKIPNEVNVEAMLPVAYPFNIELERGPRKENLKTVLYFDKWKQKPKKDWKFPESL